MKIAYLVSRYPAVSHTFVMREVQALRENSVEVITFSVRRATQDDILGPEARREADTTRWLVPPSPASFCSAVIWAFTLRLRRTCGILALALRRPAIGFRERIKWLMYFGEALQLAHWLTRERCGRLHCHFGNSGASTGLLAAHLARIPYSFTCHGSELDESHRFCLAEKVARADRVVCVSKYGRARLMLDCPPEHWRKLVVLRCGVTPPEPRAIEPGDGPAGILCVGRLSHEKGHLVLLDALSAIVKQGLDIRCTLVGDGPMRGRIEVRIRELDLQNRVTLTGSLQPAEVAGLYPAASVVVLPSLSEGVPVVLMEAMSHGRPVVATRVGGIPELVENGESGLVVSPGDACELAKALHRLLTDAELAQRLGERGRQTVRTEFNIENSVKQIKALFAAGDGTGRQR